MSLFAPKGGKGLKFPTPGTSYTGIVNAEPYEEQQKEYGSDRPATYPNGDPKMQILVNLDTQLREEADDDGRRTLYVTSAKMKRAIFDAISAAGVDDIKVGGTLTITYTGNDPQSKNPANPAKLYSASYVAPAPGAGSAFAPSTPAPAPVQEAPVQQATPQAVDPWNPPPANQVQQPHAGYQQPAQQATAPAPVQQAAPAPAPTGEPTQYDKVKQLINVGMDDQAITNATNIPIEQVAAIRAA